MVVGDTASTTKSSTSLERKAVNHERHETHERGRQDRDQPGDHRDAGLSPYHLSSFVHFVCFVVHSGFTERHFTQTSGGKTREVVYREESYRVMGACFEVYR